jgi:PAS domain S-box-containing protein
MSKAKVTHGKARNSKTSSGHSVDDSISASMRKNAGDPSTKIGSARCAERTPQRGLPTFLPQEVSDAQFFADHNRFTPPRTPAEMSKLQHAAQRYADLYDFAPTGYVSVDRSGRIAEINLTACEMFGMPRNRLIGMPFSVFVHREDTALFLNHLLRCRCSAGHVETELRLKNTKREIADVFLSSTPVAAAMQDGARLYQTAIVDLTQRKTVEKALKTVVKQQTALYEFARRRQDARSLREVYDAALDAIMSVMHADRASILLFDKAAVMRFVVWRGLSEKYRSAVEGHSPWKPETENPEPICMPDVALAELPRSLKRTVRGEGIQALAFIPLVLNKKVIGKFMIYHNTPHAFDDVELKLAIAIAQELVQAIQHRRDEEALRESEARMRATVEQATAGVARCDVNGRITFANRKLCEMLGYEESELIGKSIAAVTHPDDVKSNMRRFREMVRYGKPFEIEKRYVCKDGSTLWADVSASAVCGPGGTTQSTVAVIVDITARKKAEAALQKSKVTLEKLVRKRTEALRTANAELKNEIERRRGLEGEILSVSDREQQRLGQELHDGLCQHLTAVAFMARSVALRLRNHRVIDAADIEKIAELVNAAAIDTRNLSQALHRSDVDAAGLVIALQDLVDREIWTTPCRLEVRPSFHIQDDAAAAQLYRIAREAVINANKHAQARQIVIKLQRSREELVMRITDDGVGFSHEPKLKQGLGYHIMNYRAQLLGGRLEIDSPKRGGTCVSCYLPEAQANRENHTGKKVPKQGDSPLNSRKR